MAVEDLVPRECTGPFIARVSPIKVAKSEVSNPVQVSNSLLLYCMHSGYDIHQV